MSEQTLKLGDLLDTPTGKALVVRIVESQHSLHLDEPTGKCYTMHESFAQVKTHEGMMEFISFFSVKAEWLGAPPKIRPLQAFPWGKEGS